MKIVLTYSELRGLLAPVIPHAGTDDMLPVLTRIPVATSGPYLVAQATNRFTAAFCRVRPAIKPPKGFAVQLEARDAKRTLNLLRPGSGSDPTVTIDVADGGEVHVSCEDAGLALGFTALDVRFASPLIGSDKFPDLAGLIPKDTAETVPEQSFDFALLSSFRTAVEEHRRRDAARQGVISVRLAAQHGKAMFISAGPDFLGLIMPRRVLGATNHEDDRVRNAIDAWRDTIPRNGVNPPANPPAPVIDQSEPAAEPVGASS